MHFKRESITFSERAQARLDKKPNAMRIRRETVDHPFGTLKIRMGATHCASEGFFKGIASKFNMGDLIEVRSADLT